ncbi:hypothetical protein G6F31_021816 [Rhizopus arrhizus]|nr:hypothetical protein G6F31_021816 [Rhizopus arrhizus]
MSPLQQEYFRQRLQNWRADLVEESKQTIENLREEVRDIGDEAERATRETENSLELPPSSAWKPATMATAWIPVKRSAWSAWKRD